MRQQVDTGEVRAKDCCCWEINSRHSYVFTALKTIKMPEVLAEAPADFLMC